MKISVKIPGYWSASIFLPPRHQENAKYAKFFSCFKPLYTVLCCQLSVFIKTLASFSRLATLAPLNCAGCAVESLMSYYAYL